MLGVFTRFYFVHKKHMVLLPAQGALEKPARKQNEDQVKKKNNNDKLMFSYFCFGQLHNLLTATIANLAI